MEQYLRKSAFTAARRFRLYSKSVRFFTICLISALEKYPLFSRSSISGIISSMIARTLSAIVPDVVAAKQPDLLLKY